MRTRSMRWPSCLLLLGTLGASTRAHAIEKKLCVTVTVKQEEATTPGNIGNDTMLPVGQNPVSYLKRLIEHYVSHEKGFVAVEQGCEERVELELYPLRVGWTAFARYSGTGREERVDQLQADELSQFAERAVLALLYGKPISTTILRDTVLRADSKRAAQRVRGTNHFVLGLGAQLRGGLVPTSVAGGGTADRVRGFFPITLDLGYRGKFESWGLEALFALAIGTSRTGLQQNSAGGHVDYGGNVSFALHFLRYFSPRALTAFYLGGGGSFEVMWLYQIKPTGDRHGEDRRTLPSGGFNLDAVAGVEFMRASKVQFYLQGALLIPAYIVENGDGAAGISTWLPGAKLNLGMLF